jgi:hypothetical protein
MSTDPTPIPTEPAAPGEVCAAALVAARHAPPYKGKLIAAIDSAFAAGLAAGRTADDEIREQAYLSVLDGSAIVVRAEVDRGRTAAAADIPGWAHEHTVTFDGDTHWLECDFCEAPVHGIDAGDSLETIVTKARDHRRTCSSGGNRD